METGHGRAYQGLRIKVYVGLDVHKDSIVIGAAHAGRDAGRLIGQHSHGVAKLLKTLARLGEPETVA